MWNVISLVSFSVAAVLSFERYAFEIAGVSELEKQAEAVSSLVTGQDMFMSLPTGVGKSLCYVLLPLVLDSPPEPPEVNITVPAWCSCKLTCAGLQSSFRSSYMLSFS